MIFLNEEGSSRATVNHDNSFCENQPLISPYIMEFDVNKSVSFYWVIKYMHQKLSQPRWQECIKQKINIFHISIFFEEHIYIFFSFTDTSWDKYFPKEKKLWHDRIL